jgi:hypothetical protein
MPRSDFLVLKLQKNIEKSEKRGKNGSKPTCDPNFIHPR